MQEQLNHQHIAELRRIELMSQEGKKLAVQTNLQLHENGEKLELIDGKLNTINNGINRAEESAKQITSYWYYLKNKVKKFIGLSSNNTSEPSLSKADNEPNFKQERAEADYKINEIENGPMSEQDKILQNIIKNVKTTKDHAKELGKQIDRQNPLIDGIDKKLTTANVKMGKVNGILQRQINK